MTNRNTVGDNVAARELMQVLSTLSRHELEAYALGTALCLHELSGGDVVDIASPPDLPEPKRILIMAVSRKVRHEVMQLMAEKN